MAFRLGKRLGFEKIHTVDDDTFLDMEVMNPPSPALQAAVAALESYERAHFRESIGETYRYINSDEWSRLNHDVYMQANALGTGNPYAGAEMVAKWYERNLKIFADIQSNGCPSTKKRIFVLYGAGHLQILRDLIRADSHLRLSDVTAYL